MASKDAKKSAQKFLNSPIGAIIVIIAVIVGIISLLLGKK